MELRRIRPRRHPVSTVLDGLARVVEALALTLMTVIVVAITWQVIARYVTAASTAWAPELASLAFVWLSLLSIALGIRRGSHIVVDVWSGVRTRWLQRLIDTLAAIAVVGVLLVLLYFGYQSLPTSFARSLPGLGIAAGWINLAVPVGSALSLVFAVEAWWRNVVGRPPADAELATDDRNVPDPSAA